MTESAAGSGWWLASDGKWYPPAAAPAHEMNELNAASYRPPPPGWYPDPWIAQGQRYWDGTWTGYALPPKRRRLLPTSPRPDARMSWLALLGFALSVTGTVLGWSGLSSHFDSSSPVAADNPLFAHPGRSVVGGLIAMVGVTISLGAFLLAVGGVMIPAVAAALIILAALTGGM
jgi:hypothetical protein